MQFPGRYRLRVAYDPASQYPAVREAGSRDAPCAGEAILEAGIPTEEILRAVWEERAFLAAAFDDAAAALDALAGFEAQLGTDREAALADWTAWRTDAMPRMEAAILRGRERRDRMYPRTYREFAERLLFKGLYQWEHRRIGSLAIQGPGLHPGTGTLAGRAALDPRMLDPYRETFLRETGWYLHLAARGLSEAVAREEARQRERPDAARWGQALDTWRPFLTLWAEGISPAPGDAADACRGLQETFPAWWDAIAADLFCSPESREPPPDPSVARDAVESLLNRLETEIARE